MATKSTPNPEKGLANSALDLIHYYPKRHEIYQRKRLASLNPGDAVTVVGSIQHHSIRTARSGNLIIQKWIVSDRSLQHRLSCTHFHKATLPYTSPAWQQQQQQTYRQGVSVKLSGLVKFDDYENCLAITANEVVAIEPHQVKTIPRQFIQPIYRLAKGVDPDELRDSIQTALSQVQLVDPLPRKLKQRYELVDLQTAIAHIHFPDDTNALEAARRRLVFDEFFYLQMALLLRRGRVERPLTDLKSLNLKRLNQFKANLGFALTTAQQRVINEILDDLTQPYPMNRLVQGDVGAGKTVVAVVCAIALIEQGQQAALMVPTETLAQQHYDKIQAWLEPLNLTAALLTGSTSAKQRRSLLADLSVGKIQFLIGTHALTSAKVTYANLGLAIIDEQHRFGVKQRNALLNKGNNPHLLSMTATPIPRTLALSHHHKDMDVSLIDELPPGRKPIVTQIIDDNDRDTLNRQIKIQLSLGFQVYAVLPLVEPSEDSEMQSATEAFKSYQKAFPDYQVGLLHGRMTSQEKIGVLDAFRDNQTQILVSTTVIEVGVDIPNATVMVIEQAERFGLAQLHQLRGPNNPIAS
ncbi:MAG: ATP-dependent DNA helicase RecG [Cyanobacteria bacterium FC1]|nr:ATP-dependent DNA helicase RecG [Cyanobacteria bacterium FC1]